MSTTEIILVGVAGFCAGIVFTLWLLAVCGGGPRSVVDMSDTLHEFHEAHRIENETWRTTTTTNPREEPTP